ncbi:DUF4224 domain-containing protein [Candidimonas sp. SYP-B2681]|uniref:DUF4224 domain-containing protein n=1 Tax=Candidimonas sp. SYP-B2681 TaxID=2497686 RepID=UPI000F8748AD|nr:DUF4224 domain-containing protein [Candidimonas sp. SYP-B2681]RTZ39960.1 DUF4224 domain-containing protein [Candidimonas sp. SYP-B2681]
MLTPADLEELTGYRRPDLQRRMLDVHGIPYKAIGHRTIVISAHVVAWVEGRPIGRFLEPDLSKVR